MNVSPVRYFIVVGLHPRHGLAVLAAVTVLGVWTVTVSAGELNSSIGLLLFVQLFLASTGYLTRARRGHFDPVLTSAIDRRAIVAAHWFVSVLPGALGCIIVTLVAWARGGVEPSMAARQMAALSIVSALGWAAGFALPRGGAGALWTAVLIVLLVRRTDLLGATTASFTAASPLLIVRHAAALLVCPFLLLGARVPLVPGSVPASACVAAVSLLAAWRAAARADVYLRDPA